MAIPAYTSHTILRAAYDPDVAGFRVTGEITKDDAVETLEQGNVVVNAVSEEIIAANSSRKHGVLLRNAGAFDVHIAFGVTATTSHITLEPDMVLIVPTSDQVNGICVDAIGSRIEYVGL